MELLELMLVAVFGTVSDRFLWWKPPAVEGGEFESYRECLRAGLVGALLWEIVVLVGEDGTKGSSANTSTAKELECVRVKVNLRGPRQKG